MARRSLASMALLLPLLAAPLGCDSGEPDDRFKVEKKYIPLDERKQKVTQTPEELAEIRKKAGFKSEEELAAENAKMFEKGAREYVKTRLKDYRAFVAELQGYADEIEKEAAKWAAAKDPDKAFERWQKGYKKRTKDLESRYMKLTGNMSEGGDTTAKLGKAYRSWDNLANSLSGKIAENERFAGAVQEVRDLLAPVGELLDDIEKDDTLVVNKFYDGDEPEKK